MSFYTPISETDKVDPCSERARLLRNARYIYLKDTIPAYLSAQPGPTLTIIDGKKSK